MNRRRERLHRKAEPLPLFFIMCSRVSIRCPAAPVAVLYLPFCRCPRSCAPAGDHPTPYPRASAPLLSVLAPAFPPGSSDPASPRFRTSSLCPRSCVPAGVLRPRIPAFPHLFSLSRFRAPAGALRQSGPPPPSHEKSSPEFRRGFFVSRAPSTRCSPPLLLWFWWLLRRNVTALRPTDSVPNQSARVCRLRR